MLLEFSHLAMKICATIGVPMVPLMVLYTSGSVGSPTMKSIR